MAFLYGRSAPDVPPHPSVVYFIALLFSQDDDDEAGPSGVTYLYGHTAPVYAVDMSHDARLVLSGSGDGTVRLWSRYI
jgi:WD40 repeat protein